MNTRATSFLCLLLLLLVAAAGELRAAQPAAGSRVVFGVVPTAAATAEQGVPVDKVAPGSPAEKAERRPLLRCRPQSADSRKHRTKRRNRYTLTRSYNQGHKHR